MKRMSIWMIMALTAAWGGRAEEALNLAPFAQPATSYVSGHETLGAINDGLEPQNMGDHSHDCYGNWPQTGTQWVQLEWDRPVNTRKVEVYWWDDGRGVRLPVASRLSYWDGSAFVPVKNASGLGVAGGTWNATTFDEVTTTRLRLEMDGREKFSTGIIEWKVYDAGKSPKFPPRVDAGNDRVVVLPAKTYLTGTSSGHIPVSVSGDKNVPGTIAWSKASGPGKVKFDDATALVTAAAFSKPGDYELKLTAMNGDQSAASTLGVRVDGPPPPRRLDPVAMRPYAVQSAFWSPRLKAQIVNWIPHCIAKLSEPGLKEGGFENFVEAANKNAGRTFKPHTGPPWANAYTHNTVESMCLALMVDARGDAETAAAQQKIRAKLDEWVPVILAAQEPDGYLQTRFTLGNAGEVKNRKAPPRWTYVGDHEGYCAGYFIDAALAHFQLTEGRDRRMYDAARKLADCWDANIGPTPKKKWFDGHQALEMSLVRLGRLVNETEGAGKGDRYIALAKFLLDSRGGGDSYDQAHLPVTRQYEALGHSVRAAYNYAAMTDIAMETGDPEYHSAVKSLWNSIVNAKYYVTGGIGSGETAEGFGRNFSLPNNAYSESCSDCGQLFFQHRMSLAYHESRYADLAEETLFNAILGSVDLPGQNFTYTNPLDQSHPRYKWHDCPCCVGNIPRTLLMLPAWTFAKSADSLFVNQFIGGTFDVGEVAGTPVAIAQRTEYPWQGGVELVVNPAEPRSFALRIRVPRRETSRLYRATPAADGIVAMAVNGKRVKPDEENGYAVISRKWKAGDTVSLELPLRVQRVKADERIVADRGRVALRYGALIYNIESADQPVDGVLKPDAELKAAWEPDLLGGVVALRGTFADGKPLLAIPNYARNNRGGRSIVWIKDE